MTPDLIDRTMREIIRPTVAAMARMGAPYKGVLYAGLMLTDSGPKLIEYNCRFGDPEAQVLLPRLKSDLLAAMLATCDGVLSSFDLRWRDDVALTVVLAANGYPGTPERGTEIKGFDRAADLPGTLIFHAGTRNSTEGRLVADGGRVLDVTALAPSVTAAQSRAYEAVARIVWPAGFCRKDIGWRAVARERGKT
jgi:phosphoribosylamine--glycine ligase